MNKIDINKLNKEDAMNTYFKVLNELALSLKDEIIQIFGFENMERSQMAINSLIGEDFFIIHIIRNEEVEETNFVIQHSTRAKYVNKLKNSIKEYKNFNIEQIKADADATARFGGWGDDPISIHPRIEAAYAGIRLITSYLIETEK